MIAAALAFLIAYAWPIIDPGIASGLGALLELVTWLTWAFFAIDYLVRIAQASDRRRFVARHAFDLLVLAFPLLRPLRLLRLVTLLRVINRQASTPCGGPSPP